jgi:hypothetical protein
MFLLSLVETESLGTAATTGLLYQPRMIGDGDCGELLEWRLIGETEVFGGNLPNAPLCEPQIPHD